MIPFLKKHTNAPLPSGVINVASIFAAVSPPQFAAYSASKGGLVAFNEALRHELSEQGHQATALLPGIVNTGLFRSGAYSGQEPTAVQQLKKAVHRNADQAVLSPERVAATGLRAFKNGRARTAVGRMAFVYEWAMRLIPGPTRRAVMRRSASEYKEP